MWNTLTQQWEENFQALVAYKAEFGDYLVPAKFIYQGKKLGGWVSNQRTIKETLSPKRIQRLDDLGFVWNTLTQQWEENFQALVAYKAEFGDYLVPAKFIYQGKKLGGWVSNQRTAKDKLSPERIQRLDDLGFMWDTLTQQWEENFHTLVAYKAEFGDCLVPQSLTYQGLRLGTWVSNQRSDKETLSPERIQRLDDLGFVWDQLAHKWEENFKALAAYKAEFGDCLVPQSLTYQGLRLGTWVSNQRSDKETLSPERIQRLDDLGFVWDQLAHKWEENFRALAAYKAEFGDYLVPAKFIYQGKKLGVWVSNQRSDKEKLSPERIQRLDDLGFVWKVR